MRLAIFIDYDNLQPLQKESGLLTVVTNALFQLPKALVPFRGSCDIRVYGGWYEEAAMTERAQKLSVELANEFPSMIRVPTATEKPSMFVATAALATSLLEEPSHHLFGTYRRKNGVNNVRAMSKDDLGCCESVCPLPTLRKLLKNNRCPEPACTTSAETIVYRHEQKLVDTMLTCDIVYASEGRFDQILLISEDDDFVPPIRTAVLRGASLVRCLPKSSSRRLPIVRTGSTFLEIEL